MFVLVLNHAQSESTDLLVRTHGTHSRKAHTMGRQKYYSVIVNYSFSVAKYSDEFFENLARQSSDGSGTDFRSRDLDFCYCDRRKARAAFTRIKNAISRGASVKLKEYADRDDYEGTVIA